MGRRGSARSAVVAALVGVVLWQLTTEVRHLLDRAGAPVSMPQLWPPGSPLSLQIVTSPAFGGLHGLAIVLGLAVMFAVVLLVVRAVVTRGAVARGTVFLAAWMALVLGGFVASVVAQPIALLAHDFPIGYWYQQLGYLSVAPYWGVVVGWIAALAAALSARSAAHAPIAGYPATGAGYPGSGTPTTGAPDPGDRPQPPTSPYL